MTLTYVCFLLEHVFFWLLSALVYARFALMTLCNQTILVRRLWDANRESELIWLKTNKGNFFRTHNWIILHWALFLCDSFHSVFRHGFPHCIRNGRSSSWHDIFMLHFPWDWRASILPDKTLDFLWLDQFRPCVAFDIITGTGGVGVHWLAYPCPSFSQSLDKWNNVNLLSSSLDLRLWSVSPRSQRGMMKQGVKWYWEDRCLYFVSNLTWKAFNILPWVMIFCYRCFLLIKIFFISLRKLPTQLAKTYFLKSWIKVDFY